MWLSLLVAALTLAVDRITKLWAYYVLQPIQDIPLWEGVFHLTYARNTGAAFSFLAGKQWILIVFTLIALVIGAILLGIYILFVHDRGAAQREKANGNEDLPSQKG